MSSPATVYEIDVPTTRSPDTPRLPFKITGEMYWMRQPKLTVAVALVGMLDGSTDQPRIDGQENAMRANDALWGLVQYVEDEAAEPFMLGVDGDEANPLRPNPDAGKLHGRARMVQRLRDPHDELDITHLGPLFERIVGAIFDETPTGPSPASSASAGNGGHDSEADSSEPQDATRGDSNQASSSPRPRTSPTKAGKRK